MKQGLTKDEVAQLSDISRFNSKLGRGWKLENRTVTSVTWATIKLRDATLINCDLTDIDLTGGEFRTCTFNSVAFDGCTFAKAVAEGCRFERCIFQGVLLPNARFKDCTFVDCVFKLVEATDTDFETCGFNNLHDSRSIFSRGSFRSCTFVTAKLENTRISGATCDRCRFDGGTLTSLHFGVVNSSRLSFTQVEIKGLEFQSGAVDGLRFERCRQGLISFRGMPVKALTMSQCAAGHDVKLVDCDIDGASLDGMTCSDFSLYHSVVKGFRMFQGAITRMGIEKCKLDADCSFKEMTIVGANFEESEFNRVQFQKCSFEDYLMLSDGKFTELHLQDVSYGKNLEVRAERTVYGGADHFPDK